MRQSACFGQWSITHTSARATRLIAVIGIMGGIACAGPMPLASNAFTLYRNSVTDARMRIHVATFDAADGADYNNENCDVARELFAGQDGVTVRYWCEKGRFQP